MTDQELKDLVASLAIAQAKTEVEQVKTSVELREMSVEVREMVRVAAEMGRRLGAMGINLGDVTEEFFYNSLRAKPQLGGIKFDTVTSKLLMGTKKSQTEFDIVMANGEAAAIIEIKMKAHLNDLDQIERQIALYRQLRPEHKDFRLYGGIAGFNVPPDVIEAAQQRGMFVLQRKGEVLESATEGMLAF